MGQVLSGSNTRPRSFPQIRGRSDPATTSRCACVGDSWSICTAAFVFLYGFVCDGRFHRLNTMQFNAMYDFHSVVYFIRGLGYLKTVLFRILEGGNGTGIGRICSESI